MAEPIRCPWVDLTKSLYVEYHDSEWGVPVHDDRRMFEFLVLESAQAGLSWYTILRKREHYRRLFAGFDPERVACFSERDVERLLGDAGIVRNRAKIEAAINNAQRFLEIQQSHGSFCGYLWDFVDGRPVVNELREMADIPANSPLSDRLAKDMKQRGFRFLGTTILYSHLQATGLVQDHTLDCFRRVEILREI